MKGDYPAIDIMRFQNGYSAELARIFRAYNRSLLYFASNMVRDMTVAEEIVSDSFVKLWQARSQFKSAENIKAFLFIATKNACLNHLKSAHARQQFDYETSEELLSDDPDAYAKLIKAELMREIWTEVEKLPEKQREVFRLTYLEGFSTDEICQQLGMNASAVFANRSRATETLREVFRDKDILWCLILFFEFFLS